MGLGTLASFRPARSRRAGQRRVAWCTALAVLLVHFALGEHRLFRAAPSVDDTITLLHWNMTSAWYGANADFAASVIEHDADVAILTNPGNVLAEPALREWGQRRERFMSKPFYVASRYPIVERRWLAATEDTHIYRVVLDVPGRAPLALHLYDLPSHPRVPRADVAAAVERLLTDQDVPAADLLIGDFNITRGSAMLKRLTAGYTHAYDLAGHGYGVSYHRWSPFFHIDHILLAPDVPIARYDLVAPGFGQHLIQLAHIPTGQAR